MTILTDLFAGVLPFVHTAEARSFRRAAQTLGVTPAAVSKAIARLEGELGVPLLTRTSRHVSITREGQLFLERCREAIANVQGGREAASRSRRVPQGELSVTLPPILGPLLFPALPRLSTRHPSLAFRIHVTDRYSRMIDENIDVAIRIGELEDSSLVSRTLRRTRWVTVASPSYLARRSSPTTPSDLASHDCLKFLAPNGRPREWSFREGTSPKLPARLLVDHGELLLEASLAGMGIAQVLDFMVEEPMREGRLLEVLAPHAAEGPRVHVLSTPNKASSANVRAFTQFLLDTFRSGSRE